MIPPRLGRRGQVTVSPPSGHKANLPPEKKGGVTLLHTPSPVDNHVTLSTLVSWLPAGLRYTVHVSIAPTVGHLVTSKNHLTLGDLRGVKITPCMDQSINSLCHIVLEQRF